MRKDSFIIGQYYHIYNRGTDKRIVFQDLQDLDRFLGSIKEFNTIDPIGSIKDKNLTKNKFSTPTTELVEFVCYCLNPNHYHFILTPLVEKGIEKFMQKLGGGFTRYFNEKYKRTGVLFQGKFKSVLINSDKYLMYLSAYVNLNNRVHKFSSRSTEKEKERELFWKSSWGEYTGENKEKFCNKSIILDRYKNISGYKEFVESVVEGVIAKRSQTDLDFDEDLLIEEIQ